VDRGLAPVGDSLRGGMETAARHARRAAWHGGCSRDSSLADVSETPIKETDVKNPRPVNRLALHKETLRTLANPAMKEIAGGAIYRCPQAPTAADACTWCGGSLCDVATGYMCPDPPR